MYPKLDTLFLCGADEGASLKRAYFFSESNFWFNLFPLARRRKFERITLNSTLSRTNVGGEMK